MSHMAVPPNRHNGLPTADHPLLSVSSVYQLERSVQRPNSLNTLKQRALEAVQSLARRLRVPITEIEAHEDFHNDDIARRDSFDWSAGFWRRRLRRHHDRPAATAASGLRCAGHTWTRIYMDRRLLVPRGTPLEVASRLLDSLAVYGSSLGGASL